MHVLKVWCHYLYEVQFEVQHENLMRYCGYMEFNAMVLDRDPLFA